MDVLVVLLPLHAACVLVAKRCLVDGIYGDPFLFFDGVRDSLDRVQHLLDLLAMHLAACSLVEQNRVDAVRVVLQKLLPDPLVLILNLAHLEAVLQRITRRVPHDVFFADCLLAKLLQGVLDEDLWLVDAVNFEVENEADLDFEHVFEELVHVDLQVDVLIRPQNVALHQYF